MNCPFCSQWNPEGRRRCCFCNNLLDAVEDATVAGRPAYETHRHVTVPSAPQRFPGAQGAERSMTMGRVSVKLALTNEQIIGGGVTLLVLILLAFSRC